VTVPPPRSTDRTDGVRALRWGAALAPVVLVLAACGDDDDGDASASDVDAATLEGRTFVSTEVDGETLVDGTEISLSFDEGTMSVRAGCNTLFGGFEVEASSLVADELAQTQMACDDANQAQDIWVLELLEGRPTIAVAGDTLTLSDDAVSVTLTEEASGGG
jgi:heat shock protein HslJ